MGVTDLAKCTSASKTFLPSFALVSMKMALWSLAVFSPSSVLTHFLPAAHASILKSTLLAHSIMGIRFSLTSCKRNKENGKVGEFIRK